MTTLQRPIVKLAILPVEAAQVISRSSGLLKTGQDEKNLKHVYEGHVNTDMTYSQFRDLCSSCWIVDKYGFLFIDKDSNLHESRYRKGFDSYNVTNA